jgi:hypothetical protein
MPSLPRHVVVTYVCFFHENPNQNENETKCVKRLSESLDAINETRSYELPSNTSYRQRYIYGRIALILPSFFAELLFLRNQLFDF